MQDTTQFCFLYEPCGRQRQAEAGPLVGGQNYELLSVLYRCWLDDGKSHQTYGNYVTFPKHLHYILFNVGFLYEPALAGT